MAKLSIKLIETAEVAGIPWRWKKRMSSAMRATLPGTTRLMKAIVNCNRTTGP
ncbi:MAG TPA: hypothetical protein VMF65_01180 [Acidimicrobiales bacterium]|nr:hypothetical protein [Acidimicrobiales bacterium]